jgi:AcrR family transcriptional regulator
LLTRRERLRTATVAEIKEFARQLLVAGGPPAISLRAIAREMGMTAPAIYRYFPSLDALVAELTGDLYAELTAAVEAVRTPEQATLDQLVEMARAFRRWSLAHPAEFGLLFGNPVPGVTRFEEDCLSPDHAGARFGAPFLEAFATLFDDGRSPQASTGGAHDGRSPQASTGGAHDGRSPQASTGGASHDVTGRGLTEAQIAPFTAASGVALPPPVVHAYLAAWARLYGLVALEVFGHMRWAMHDTSALFEVELAAFLDELRSPDELR